ncbi:hypothetical protein [Streptomyces sp. ODS05-4]|uniref:hypothetical protein n=1 Tax=Streptomyces sp. ODS05-4 TaxID=2944939 RepID=UPI00210DEDDA|nr:hypothetical protein [Streptomyces sp. ODS05-4]
MPRPITAQLAYGSATTVLATVTLLLASGATSGPDVALVGVASLLLGVLVAVGVRLPAALRARAKARTAGRHTAAPTTGPHARRPRAGAETPAREHSLRR